jgi:hypothetical protein
MKLALAVLPAAGAGAVGAAGEGLKAMSPNGYQGSQVSNQATRQAIAVRNCSPTAALAECSSIHPDEL